MAEDNGGMEKMPEIVVGPVTEYSEAVVSGINILLPQLDPKFGNNSMTRELLEERIACPTADQFIATRNGEVIGSGVMSVVHGSLAGKRGHLEDFIVSEDARGTGVGKMLWEQFIAWCNDRGLKALGFDSELEDPELEREAALKFYKKRGVEMHENSRFFWLDLTKPVDEQSG